MEKKYNLTFEQAIKIVLDGGCVKGHDFMDGICLKLNDIGQLVTVDAAMMYKEDTEVFFKSLSRQKFREISVMTMNELCG